MNPLTPKQERAFWSHIEVERFDRPNPMIDRCWFWTAYCRGNPPQPRMRVGASVLPAAHVSYEIFRGDVPLYTRIHHTCGDPLCVHPLHLELAHKAVAPRRIYSPGEAEAKAFARRVKYNKQRGR